MQLHDGEGRSGAARIVSGSYDQTVRVWDGESGEEVAMLEGHDSEVISVCSFRTAEGAVRIVSGCWDKTVRVWDAESGEEVAVLKGHDDMVWSVCSFTTAEGAVQIMSGSDDKTVRVWRAVSGDCSSYEVIEVISGEGTVWALHAPNARRLYAAIGSVGHPLIYALKDVGPGQDAGQLWVVEVVWAMLVAFSRPRTHIWCGRRLRRLVEELPWGCHGGSSVGSKCRRGQCIWRTSIIARSAGCGVWR